MFSAVRNGEPSLFKKFTAFPKSKSKRKECPKLSLALLRSSNFYVASPCASPSIARQGYVPVIREEKEESNGESSKMSKKNHLKSFHSYYSSNETFNTALEEFNQKMEESCSAPGSSMAPQRWECKGKVRVSFQLCVMCKDVGKVRSETDTYYLDVLEIEKYRTILCKGCLAYLVHKKIGSSIYVIEKK